MLKRVYDIVFSVFFIIIFSPICLITAVIIKITSKGPVMYKAQRVGKEGKLFTCYKFRSMHINSGQIHITTLRNDPRIYPFGRFIRKTKIDELPQLFNVLFGQMSVVGPRPEDQVNAEQIYTGEFIKLLKAKPGLTSLGSIYDYTHGEQFENEEDYTKLFLPEKMQLELYYIQNASFIYDIFLTFKTAVVILCIAFGKKSFKKPKELNPIQYTEEPVKQEV